MVGNRPVSEQKQWEYAIALDQGRWALNGESIKFDDQGRLFDGQHRCLAVILAEKTMVTYVVRGIDDPNAFATVDTGKGRTTSDVFAIAGWQNNKTASGAAMLIMAYRDHRIALGGLTGRRMMVDTALADKMKRRPITSAYTREEIVNFGETVKEELNAAVRFASGSKATRLTSASNIAALYFLFRDKSRSDADKFFTDLGEGVGLMKSDPVYMLREKLIASKGDKAKLTKWAILALTIKAWNQRRGAEVTKTLRIVEGEKFPVIR